MQRLNCTVKSSLVLSLKKQIRELKESHARKDEEIENWKRNTKATRYQELDVMIALVDASN